MEEAAAPPGSGESALGSAPPPLSVAAARAEMLDHVPSVAAEAISVDAGASGRVLAEDVVARVLLPPWDNSAMDGYAVRAADTARVPVTLPVVGAMAAGSTPGSVTVGAGTCAKVMTGAPMPVGADSVVPYEWTDRGAGRVLIEASPSPGNAVRRAGEDLTPGERVFTIGHRLRATDLGPLAACGLAEVRVSRRPRVAVLTTGDELRPAGSELGPGEIYDTAGPALEALVAAAGGEVVFRHRLRDIPDEVEAELQRASQEAELVVTVGGVSVGDHDHVKAAVERLGRLRLWRVAMRPGRPVAFGQVGDSAFLGLPGNPASSSVTFVLFGAPCLLAMQGASRHDPPTEAAELLEEVGKPEGLETFHRAVLVHRPGRLPGARLAGNQSSGATLAMARADALLALPAKGSSVSAGEVVEVIPLR